MESAVCGAQECFAGAGLVTSLGKNDGPNGTEQQGLSIRAALSTRARNEKSLRMLQDRWGRQVGTSSIALGEPRTHSEAKPPPSRPIGCSRRARYPTSTNKYSLAVNSASREASPVSTRSSGVRASLAGVETTVRFSEPTRRSTAGETWRFQRLRMNPCGFGPGGGGWRAAGGGSPLP